MSTADMLEVVSEPSPVVGEPMITDEAMYERIDGERVELPRMSIYANRVAARLGRLLNRFVDGRVMGEVYPEMLFRLALPDGRVRDRRPDLAFVSFERWPADKTTDPYQSAWEVVPDLAVEVVSPTDSAEDLRAKVLEYFSAGVRQVWVVYPISRVADVFEAVDRVRVVAADAELDGGDVLPGFRLVLRDILGA